MQPIVFVSPNFTVPPWQARLLSCRIVRVTLWMQLLMLLVKFEFVCSYLQTEWLQLLAKWVEQSVQPYDPHLWLCFAVFSNNFSLASLLQQDCAFYLLPKCLLTMTEHTRSIYVLSGQDWLSWPFPKFCLTPPVFLEIGGSLGVASFAVSKNPDKMTYHKQGDTPLPPSSAIQSGPITGVWICHSPILWEMRIIITFGVLRGKGNIAEIT